MPSITITTSAPQAQRLATAFGGFFTLKDAQGNPRAATELEIKAWIVQRLREIVMQYEHDKEAKAITVAPFEPT